MISTPEDSSSSAKRTLSKTAFRLSTLFLIMALAGALFGWFIDHNALQSQIPKPPTYIVMAYVIQNADGGMVADKLNELYVRKSGVANLTPPNQIVVHATRQEHNQIELIIRHLDRPGTDLVKAPKTAAAVEAEGEPIAPQDR